MQIFPLLSELLSSDTYCNFTVICVMCSLPCNRQHFSLTRTILMFPISPQLFKFCKAIGRYLHLPDVHMTFKIGTEHLERTAGLDFIQFCSIEVCPLKDPSMLHRYRYVCLRKNIHAS